MSAHGALKQHALHDALLCCCSEPTSHPVADGRPVLAIGALGPHTKHPAHARQTVDERAELILTLPHMPSQAPDGHTATSAHPIHSVHVSDYIRLSYAARSVLFHATALRSGSPVAADGDDRVVVFHQDSSVHSAVASREHGHQLRGLSRPLGHPDGVYRQETDGMTAKGRQAGRQAGDCSFPN